MRTLLLATAAAVLAAAPLTNSSATPDQGYHHCSSFKAQTYTIRVYATNITCRKAVKIQREWWQGADFRKHRHEFHPGGDETLANTYYTLDRFPGWKCTSGSGGGSCHKGKRSAGYQN